MGGIFGKNEVDGLNKNETEYENKEQIFIVENDNLKIDLKIDSHYEISYSSTINELKSFTKYEIHVDEYKEHEEKRLKDEGRNFIITRDFIENNSKRDLFIKVIDFTILKQYNMGNNFTDDLQIENFHKMNKKCKRLIKEIILLKEYRFRFFEQPIGYFQDKSKIFVIFEKVDYSLKELIINELGPFLNRLRLLKSLIETIIELHSKGIVSLDISPTEIGYNKDLKQIKLLSFGNSIVLKDSNSDILVESWFSREKFSFFTAPEVYTNLKQVVKYIWSLDIWSLGMLTYCIFTENESKFLDNLDDLFKENEKQLYTDKFNYDKFLSIIDFSQTKIENVFIRAMISTMLKPGNNERSNIFQIADSYNKIIRLYELEKDGYLINYEKSEILSFLKVFDNFTYNLLIQG